MARVKNSNCLNFCSQVDPSKTRKVVHFFFPQTCFYFREKRTFHFYPPESMKRVITGRKLNTFARFAFQRYYIKGNLSNVCSFIDSLSSVKSKLCRNQLLRSFQQCGKAMCSLPLQIKVGEEDFFFSPCAIMQNATKLRNTRHFLMLVIINGPQYSLFSFKKLLWSILHFLLYYYYIIIFSSRNRLS